MYESGNLLWETDVLEELKGAGESYFTYKQAVDTYSSALQSGDQKALEEAYTTIERLAPLISQFTIVPHSGTIPSSVTILTTESHFLLLLLQRLPLGLGNHPTY